MPRGDTGNWDPFYLKMYIFSHALIFLAYAMIAVTIVAARNVRVCDSKKSDPKESGRTLIVLSVLLMFSGLGRLEGVIAFLHPYYHLFAVYHMITSIMCWIAVWILFRNKCNIVTQI